MTVVCKHRIDALKKHDRYTITHETPMMQTILITGGHLTPAMAFIEEAKKLHPEWLFVMVGRKHELEGDTHQSREWRFASDFDIPFYPINAGRLSFLTNIRSIFSLVRIPIGFFQAWQILKKTKPSCIVSFGGYIALPVVLVGRILGIPSITHEQTSRPGIANTIIAYFSRRIAVSYADQERTFYPGKSEYTGPLFRVSVNIDVHRPIGIQGTKKTILITGGTTGSVSLNRIIFPLISELAHTYHIIHQTGSASRQEALSVREKISESDRDSYHVYEYLSETEMIASMRLAMLVIARSGANTVAEISRLAIPAIFVPLPWSRHQEQYHNAEPLMKNRSAIVLKQEDLTSSLLLHTIRTVDSSYQDMKNRAIQYSKTIPIDGSKVLVRMCEKEL